MAKTASLNIRIDPETKKSAEELFADFGITITDAVNMFLKKALMEDGLPFAVNKKRYSAEFEAAIQECEDMLASGKYKTYTSTQEMMRDILAEDENV